MATSLLSVRFFSNFAHNVEQTILRPYGVKKRKIFSARLPVRDQFVQTLKTVFSLKTTLKNRPILKIQKPENPFNNSASRDLMFDFQNP